MIGTGIMLLLLATEHVKTIPEMDVPVTQMSKQSDYIKTESVTTEQNITKGNTDNTVMKPHLRSIPSVSFVSKPELLPVT